MIGALIYLRLVSLRNLVVYRVRRLRQPKYLIGTLAALAYLYSVFGRRAGAQVMAAPGSGGEFAAQMGALLICSSLVAVGLVRIAFIWIAPAEKPGLRFSEAEIAFLFPAPVTRRSLIHFRLLSVQAGILFTSVIMAFFLRRASAPGLNRAFGAVSWWVVLSTFEMHVTGTQLFLARLREKSAHFVAWRVAVVLGIVAYAAAVVLLVVLRVGGSEHSFLSAGYDPTADLANYAPLRWLTLPPRLLVGPYLARTPAQFLMALLPALGLLGLHYSWVCNSETRFEEGSIALAEKRASAKEAALRGELPRAKPRRASRILPIPRRGPVELALLWKNLLAMHGSLLSRRLLFVAAGIMLGLFMSLWPALRSGSHASALSAAGPVLVAFSSIVAAYTLIIGPQLARQDLRSDLQNIDILKSYPIEGWRLALGELLAPTLVLTVILWFAIVVAMISADTSASLDWLTPGVRVSIGMSLMAVAPVLCLIQLIVPNALMLLLPGWYQATRSRSGGIEMFGQRLVFGVLQFVVALVVAAPAAFFAGLVVFCSKWLIGVGPASVLASMMVVPVMAGEAAFGLWLLGEQFKTFDLSQERT